MKAAGLDTSVVVRLLIGVPESQALAAKAFLDVCQQTGRHVCVSDMVVAEAYHALLYHYEVPKREAIHALREFLSAPMIQATGHAHSVLADYQGTGPGLVDRIIRLDLLQSAAEIVTFDADFAKLDKVRRLK